MRHLAVRSLALLLITPVLTACGAGQTHSRAPASSTVQAAFRGSPPALTALHDQANQLLGGGASAFRARLAALHGLPVVVNKWASWCGPCQSEFPIFQRVSVKLGRQVAFLGLDGKDANPSAAAFLQRYPVTYPSYTDPREVIAGAFAASTYYPQTLFFTRTGHAHYVFDHTGPYVNATALEHDIHQYLLR